MDTTSKQLIERWKQGDQQAASALWDRYMERLLGLVNQRLASRYRSRFGASDVCQSALRSMLRRVQGDEYSFEHDGGVWSLLAQIALNKLNSRIRFEQAKRRSLSREKPMAAGGEEEAAEFVDAISREPSGVDVAEFRDLLREVLKRLSSEQRRYLVLQLRGGYSQKEIAKRLKLCDRTIRRMSGRIHEKVGDLLDPEGQLRDSDSDGDAEPPA
jgi:RNA polymerase sigma factor (sigma-70 family)